MSRTLSSVRIGLLVSYSSQLYFLLTACPTFYLNHKKWFLKIWWLTAAYCSVHCIFTAVQPCSAQQSRCVCYNISLLLCIFCIRYIKQAGSIVLSVFSLFRMLQFLWQSSTVSPTSSLKYPICANTTILITSHSVNITLHYGAGTINLHCK